MVTSTVDLVDVIVVQQIVPVTLLKAPRTVKWPYDGRKLRGGMLRIDLPVGCGRVGWQRKNGCESDGYCDSG